VGEAFAGGWDAPDHRQHDRRRSALRKEIALTRQRGFAIDDEEHAIGLRCVAALVFNELREPMAAISISGPATRISHSNLAAPVPQLLGGTEMTSRRAAFDGDA